MFVLGRGDNRYQFVHADDLADACLRAADRPGPAVYNIGATEFGTMRETLQALVDHAGTGSRVRSLPVGAGARRHAALVAELGLAPFAPYHWLLYGESLWFDTTRARTELGWQPAALQRLDGRSSPTSGSSRTGRELGRGGGSHHQSPVRPGLLRLLKLLP